MNIGIMTKATRKNIKTIKKKKIEIEISMNKTMTIIPFKPTQYA